MLLQLIHVCSDIIFDWKKSFSTYIRGYSRTMTSSQATKLSYMRMVIESYLKLPLHLFDLLPFQELFSVLIIFSIALIKCSAFSADYRWWSSWVWYVWLSSLSLLVRTLSFLQQRSWCCAWKVHDCDLIFHPLSFSFSLQCTSVLKKNCSYPSLIPASLLQKTKIL